jgi:hypothetical protein
MLSSTSSLGMKLLSSSKLIHSPSSILLALTALVTARLLLCKATMELERATGLRMMKIQIQVF